MEPDDALARGHWRNQLVLTAVAAVVVLTALSLVIAAGAMGERAPVSGLRLAADGRHIEITRPAEHAYRVMIWPALVGVGAVGLVLGATLLHAARVAAFTFREDH